MLKKEFLLNNNIKMPSLGLGVFQITSEKELFNAIDAALNFGYKSFDTAMIYKNEEFLGNALKELLPKYNLKREDIFITSKVWNSDQGFDSTLIAYEKSLKNLKLDYLDLYLIHWPVKEKYKETYKALEKIYSNKEVKSIGVSNFTIEHLQNILKDANYIPVLNQVELHPRLTQKDLYDFCNKNNIKLQAWSPLMQGGEIFEINELKEIAKNHNKTVAQVVLNWNIQNEIITIPKSVNKERIKENINIFDFQLSKKEIEKIESLNKNKRIGPDPNNFNF